MPQAEFPIVGKTNIRQFTQFGLYAPAVIVHSGFVGSLKSSCLILGLLFIFFGIKVVYSAIYNKKKYSNLLQVIKENYRTFGITSDS